MKVITTLRDDGSISFIHSFDYYREKKKTDEEIVNAVESSNKSAGREMHKIVEIPDEYDEMLSFLLGEKKYRRSYYFEDILNAIDCLREDIESVECSLDEFDYGIERIWDKVNDIKKDVDNAIS